MKRVFMHKFASLSISCLLACSAFAAEPDPSMVDAAPDTETFSSAVQIITHDEIRKEMKAQVQEGYRQSMSETIKAQREEMFCGPDYMPIAELTHLAVTCWDKKKSKDSDPELSERQLLEADQSVCACLGESTNIHIKNKMRALGIKVIPNASAEALKNFRDNVSLSQKRLQDLQNGMMFQASILSGSDTKFTESYSQGQMRKLFDSTPSRQPASEKMNERRESVNNMRTVIKDELTRGFIEHKGLNRLTAFINTQARTEKGALSDGVRDALKEFKIPQADTALLTDTPMLPGQCVTAREYLAYRQIPEKPAFYTAVKSRGFTQTDWNYPVLERELKILAETSEGRVRNKERITAVRAKMEFLNRNPMIKHFMAASLATNDAYYESAKISKEEQNKIINNPAWTKLDESKAKLFNIISGLQLDNKNSVEEFRKNATQFFNDPNIAFLTNLEVEKSIFREFDNLKNPNNMMPAKLPTTQKELEAKFAENSNFISPGECNKGGANVEKCVDSYAAYCRLLTKAEEQMDAADVGAEDLSSDVTFENMDNFDANLSTNPDFKKFNDKICNSRWISKNPAHKQSQTFFQYKDDYCRSNPRNGACSKNPSNEDIRKVRESFLASYNEIEQSANKAEDKRMADNFAGVSKALNSSKGMAASEAHAVASSENSGGETVFDRISNFFGNKSEGSKSTDEFVAVNPKAEEGSALSGFARGMENFATSMGGAAGVVPMEDVSAIAGSAAIASQSSVAATANADNKITDDEKEKIRAEAQDEIARTKKELQAATNAAQKDSLEARMKMMEDLLAQKTENESKYQKLIEQLTKKTDELSAAESKAVAAAKSESALRKPASNNVQADYGFDNFDSQNNRAPSSYGDSSSYGGTGGGTAGGSTGGSGGGSAKVSATARGSSRAAGNFNTALLEAQEAKTGKIQKSSDGSIIIASDAETPILKSMSNAANGANDYSISVPAADYMGFESQNVETLKRYQEKLLGSMDSNQPVRMVVKSDKKDPLEFFVVKEGSKLFFKPVRKSGATLEALKMAVKKNP